ncbi:unnamed protein product [Cyclocybe aegerita]|uniref:Tubulin-tyrosine ligase n=1 Tax=Cyclocybe aegerita TaxID=1973307 RepID=A0A8S0XVS1_CYCAE|nr:unnamed protein product [Cyclocybe aegerita]
MFLCNNIQVSSHSGPSSLHARLLSPSSPVTPDPTIPLQIAAMLNALVSWPTTPLTDSLVRAAIKRIGLPTSFVAIEEAAGVQPLLQWSTYDDIDHERTHFDRTTVLASSYIFRKALIRKHYLSRGIQAYLKKRPDSILASACPSTFEVEISFADELDEMWTDELWELGYKLDSCTSWWILKPGMADRGMGIRIFHTKEELQQIFESFEDSDSENEEAENDGQDVTAVVISQLRHFVIQDYINTPLLLDPSETTDREKSTEKLIGRKFHLRAYCVAAGALQLYLYNRVLALFSSIPYEALSINTSGDHLDLRAHLTNTSLQTEHGENNVRLLTELEGCHILSGEGGNIFTLSSIEKLLSQMSEVLSETFKASLQNPVHFQPLPNAFELFGVDFLVSHDLASATDPFQVKILEINVEPAIELTGPRLTWILEELFISIAEVCVRPFFQPPSDGKEPNWKVGEMRHNLLKCLDESVQGPAMQ